MSGAKIISMNPVDRSKALFEDLKLIVKDASGNEDFELSNEGEAILATMMNLFLQSGMVGRNAQGQPIVVHPSFIIETVAKEIRGRVKEPTVVQ